MTIDDLKNALMNSWSKETSYNPETWKKSNPALGQCAVSALIVNDYLGGEIVWSKAILPNEEKISHYFNKIDNQEIDLTSSQFPDDTIIPSGIEKKKDFNNTREFMLSNKNTKKRYETLKKKVKKYLEIY